MLHLPDNRVGRVGRQDPLAGDTDHVFVLEPEEAEVVDALRKVRLDDDVARESTPPGMNVLSARLLP